MWVAVALVGLLIEITVVTGALCLRVLLVPEEEIPSVVLYVLWLSFYAALILIVIRRYRYGVHLDR